MNKQLVFNDVVTHLLEQGERSLADRNRCAYRNTKGQKCAIGAMIPDEAYRAELENLTVWNIWVWKALDDKYQVNDANDLPFLDRLQNTHDHHDVPSWPRLFLDLAKEYNLDLPDALVEALK